MTMTNHVSFDEITDVIYMERITPESIKLVHKVHSHVLMCRECKEIYDTVLTIRETQETDGKPAIHDMIHAAARIEIMVQNGYMLRLKKLENILSSVYYNFEHPMALSARDSMSKEDESRLVDEENDYNRIELQHNNLVISLDACDWENNTPRVLILDRSNNICFFADMELRDDRFYAELPIVENEEYKITIGLK